MGSSSEVSSQRCCAGHEMSLIIQQTVLSFDLMEEVLVTLFCYLELHPSSVLQCLRQSYSTCSITCYRGGKQLEQLASRVPAVAAALSLCREKGHNVTGINNVKFNVIEMCRRMGWDSAIVKGALRGLQWADDGCGPRKTGVIVEFSDLSFRLRCAGDLTNTDRDALCEYLIDKVQRQQTRSLLGLKTLHSYLLQVAKKTLDTLIDEDISDLSSKLKQHIDGYLMQEQHTPSILPDVETVSDSMTARVRRDIRAFLSVHGSNELTAQSITKIFQGIPSPCYPANVWGRVQFWRRYIDIDFNTLLNLTMQEMVHM